MISQPIPLCSASFAFFDLKDQCTRVFWSSFPPTVLVLFICIFYVPLSFPAPLRKVVDVVKGPFKPFLTLEEAEVLLGAESETDNEPEAVTHNRKSGAPPRWKMLTITAIGLVQAIFNFSYTVYLFYNVDPSFPPSFPLPLFPFLLSAPWLYTSAKQIFKPTQTVPYDLFSIYLLLFSGTLLLLGGALYDRQVYDVHISPPQATGIISQLICVLFGLGVVLTMPLGVPSERVKKEEIGKSVSPEDYTTLWKWITFHWVKPLLSKGRNTVLDEDDVWNLSPELQSKPVFSKFVANKYPTLLRRLLAANSLDIILDFSLTYVSVMLKYTGPFFMKLILDAIDHANPTPERLMKAYICAFLAFICALLNAQADLQHLWFARRMTTRIRSEIMAAIYDKALKRRDYSGIVNKEKAKAKMEEGQKRKEAGSTPGGKKDKKGKKDNDKDKEKEAIEKGDDPKAGADVGKIVNLMAGDARALYNTAESIFMLYSAPLEVLIAGYYLYRLLGLSAFAGVIILIIGWPLNKVIAGRAVRINKGNNTARDKRMSVVNELISSIKFIKFFAWEEKWIQKTLHARDAEMKWMVKGAINSVMFHLLWSCSPVLVSIVSFFSYVMSGNELTISVAFTSIMLFAMIRTPLNIIPTYIVHILQAGVSLKRVSVYLDEDEVDTQVSLLKKDLPDAERPTEWQGLGLKDATLKWNEVPEEEGGKVGKSIDKKGKKPVPPTRVDVDNESVATSATSMGNVDLLAEESADHRFELKDIDIMFPEGELTVIIGPTASGKTALLMALLGEMTLIQGELIMSKDPSSIDRHGNMHTISYAAQSPWLRHQPIKDNILFGYPYDEERYNAVVEACALRPDLDVLEDGDKTEIGARGVSLSGGQKARVALARAVYARSKYILLDDPLSAVDSHTSRFLYEKLFNGPLLAERTVILVTHHMELVLPGAYYLVRMLDGRIDTKGTIRELREMGVLDDITHNAEVEAQNEERIEKEMAAVEETGMPAADTKKPRKLVEDEHRETGAVKWSIYKTYLKASSYWIWAILSILVVATELLGVSEKFWIKMWGDSYVTEGHYTLGYLNRLRYHQILPKVIIENRSFVGIELPSATDHPLFYVGIYSAIGLGGALVSVLSVTAQFFGAVRASRKLFRQLLVTVVGATFRFYDTTPQGRLLNRFGKDIETIDNTLADSLQSVNTALAGFIAAILTIAIVFPYFLIPAFLIGFAYRELAIAYLNTGRDLRRMESNSRSPIFSEFQELLEGIVTVRAFSAERRFLDSLHLKIDLTTKMWYFFWMTNRWLLLNFDSLGALGVLITTLFAITTLSNSAGLAGVCITSAMSYTLSVYWACRSWTSLELDLNSVERIVEYLDLPQEPPAIIESNRVPAYWPSSSNKEALISVENLVVKYAPDLPAVLHGVSFTLKAGERVGLLGRTGSGKSTLAMSLLRFVDPISGRIVIDGIDVSSIGIHDLRSRLTFIPQDATLFSGTLRDNLDPFGEYEDSDCLDVLYRVHLINPDPTERASRDRTESSSRVASKPASIVGFDCESTSGTVFTSVTDVDSKTTLSLETQVAAGGTNFSQGQRQLIAMARALLRRSSIIILDEATSSIDFATDAKIQTAIREEFKASLLLTVAHRLRTVIDYDRLIVLDKGQIAEFDSPFNLILKEDGIFRNMCLKSGQYGELEAAAKEKAKKDSAEA